MGRAPCCSKVGLRRGPWSPTEDALLIKYIEAHGEGLWRFLPKKAGLLRCGKSCRLRWVNYLRPGIKRGDFGSDEDDLLIRLHSLLGNRWSLIAGRLPGRTDNEIKNYWNIHLSKRLENARNDTTTLKEVIKYAPKPKERTSKSTNTTRKDHPNMKTNVDKAIADDGPPIPMKTKVYIPKPIRLSSFSPFSTNNIVNNPISQSSSQGEVDDKGIIDNAAELSNPPSSSCVELKDATSTDGGVQPRDDEDDDHHELFNGFDLSLQFQCLGGDNILENLYDEYLQLL